VGGESDEIGWLNDRVFNPAQLSVYDSDVLGGDIVSPYKTITDFFAPWPRLQAASAVLCSR
jgi:hypothetical protein